MPLVNGTIAEVMAYIMPVACFIFIINIVTVT